MVQKNSQKFSNNFYCEKCDYKTCRKSDFNKHLQSKKHNDTNDTLNDTKKFSFICNCGNIYKYHSGFYRHKKVCKFSNENKEIIINNDKDNMKDLVLELIKQNNDLQKTIKNIIPNIGNNNVINSNNKSKFNINVFLNEKCKDAITMDEFINKIEISMKNLLMTKEKGLEHGITNIIIENMNKLSLYERPLHCTDKKRETLYIKNEEWEKDENKECINKALKTIESKQLKNLQTWLDNHPNYMNNSKEQEEFAKLMSECGKSVEEGREKIIKNLCDSVYIQNKS